jgi:hypothetical protein
VCEQRRARAQGRAMLPATDEINEPSWHRPSFFAQYLAVAKKNFALKRRNRKHTMQELAYPVLWSFFIVKVCEALTKAHSRCV